ncbi:MAG: hypothetical protein FIA97_17940 [Methylococcaceae bacterium]|nr:hypothetical protein [Methylococcaceae bacterium]
MQAKQDGAAMQVALGVDFLLDTFLWPNKEKYLAFGGETPIQLVIAQRYQTDPKTKNDETPLSDPLPI